MEDSYDGCSKCLPRFRIHNIPEFVEKSIWIDAVSKPEDHPNTDIYRMRMCHFLMVVFPYIHAVLYVLRKQHNRFDKGDQKRPNGSKMISKRSMLHIKDIRDSCDQKI